MLSIVSCWCCAVAPGPLAARDTSIGEDAIVVQCRINRARGNRDAGTTVVVEHGEDRRRCAQSSAARQLVATAPSSLPARVEDRRPSSRAA